jgi:phage terminase large subunit
VYYATAFAGAYYATHLAQAAAEGRIGIVTPDPLGLNASLLRHWRRRRQGRCDGISVVQFAGDRILVLDYIEGQGQVLAYYVNELRARGHQGATIYLPHDGVNTNIVTGKRLEDHLRDAGSSVTTIKNQGPGAASMRIEAARRLSSKVWFNEDTTEAGRDALGYYHERRDARRDIQLGPEHAADAFGFMVVSYEEPGVMAAFNRKLEYSNYGIV